MVAEERKLRWQGYEVYRFGGYELGQINSQELVAVIFSDSGARAGASLSQPPEKSQKPLTDGQKLPTGIWQSLQNPECD